ncbi:PREDICTED: proclotting enzyme-like [Nicrophorus vespilloides]|uniref:Proclotting enzyme-like n=1 Tax=Nicrophorus vespilloides TaxID=110193 RepID=A0ABM1N615_NICVS|nr:PREDICTED: proclotting enzyme-like [Nicrophorus vespilloides]
MKLTFWILLSGVALFALPNAADYVSDQTYFTPWEQEKPSRWIRLPQMRRPERQADKDDEGRHFGADTIFKISETLGAINTVGRYLVNMTRGNRESGDGLSQEVPSAIYTISKNVLGRNVTDSIAPLVREALPPDYRTTPPTKTTTTTTTEASAVSRVCTTPDGLQGYCDDLRDCPQLLLNLSNLRQSLCFKSLFEPGVCCPRSNTDKTTTIPPIPPVLTGNPIAEYVPPELENLVPIITSTQAPQIQQPSLPPSLSPVGNIVDPEDCGQPENANFRVVGGEEALPGRWPWMAAIFLHGSRRTEFWCGGTLISPKHILTAAHCTRDSRQRPFSAHQFTVRLGDIDLKRENEPSAPVTFKVTDIRVHKEYNRLGFYNDIAILALDRPARKSKYVIPICLPQGNLKRESFAGRRSTVVGWGTTYYGGKESTTQRQAELPIWRNEDCKQAYFQPITSNFICAGYSEGGTDACQGDSGGPLMINWDARWTQIGVVSFGNKCGEPGYPGVYTRVTEYIDWIKKNTY